MEGGRGKLLVVRGHLASKGGRVEGGRWRRGEQKRCDYDFKEELTLRVVFNVALCFFPLGFCSILQALFQEMSSNIPNDHNIDGKLFLINIIYIKYLYINKGNDYNVYII